MFKKTSQAVTKKGVFIFINRFENGYRSEKSKKAALFTFDFGKQMAVF